MTSLLFLDIVLSTEFSVFFSHDKNVFTNNVVIIIEIYLFIENPFDKIAHIINYIRQYSCIALSKNNFKLKYMFRPIIIDPIVFQITLVVGSLLAISIWQKLRTASGIVIGVYAIYMISLVSANNKVASSQPLRLAYHEYSNFDKFSIKIEESSEDVVQIDKTLNIEKIDIDKPATNSGKESDKKTNIDDVVSIKADNSNPISSDIPFKVLNMKTGTSVINRSIVNEKNAFTTDVDRVYFLSGVQNKNDSKVLFHKWYHKGMLKSKIKMESKKSYNWRSWSYITVNPQKTGDWRVVIEDQGGTRYDSLSFVINDYSI